MKLVSGMLFLFLLFFLNVTIKVAWAGQALNLLARSDVMVSELGLTPGEWQWVREHRKIRLAVWLPVSPPYEITTGLNDYGGINADFVKLVADNLGVEIDVIRYPDYASALVALREGSADFIAQAGDNQRSDKLLLSISYSPNTAVEVVNGDAMPEQTVRKIAVAPAYDQQKVLARYPSAQIVAFSSARHALEALAFRNIDLWFGDDISARYLVSLSNLSNLRIRVPATPFPASGFAFAAMPDKKIWITILNKVLKALPESAGVEIRRRWNGGVPLSLSEQKPVFTSLEHKWIHEHTHIRVAVAEDNAPVAFFDETDELNGIIADILTALRLRTGFIFEIQRYPTQKAALEAVSAGQADLLAGGTQDDIWRADLITTRTWLYNSWVMVGKPRHAPDAMNPKIVSLEGQLPEKWLHQQSAGISQKVGTWRQGLDLVARGESDMMAMPLIVANAMLASKEYASLSILAGIDIDPMRYSFGVSRHAWPLITILNKALINIPPEDLHALTRGGSTGNRFVTASAQQSSEMQRIISGVLVVVLLALVVGYYRRQQQRRLLLQLNAIPFPLFICDSRGVVQQVNQALCDSLSVERAQVAGSRLSAWFSGVEPFRNGDRGVVYYHDRVLALWRSPVASKQGFIGGWIDETRQRQFVERLRQARRQAGRSSRAKNAYLITMSHEIRTPVSAILGMLELVMKRTEDRQQNLHAIQVAWDAAQSLLLLIGNILDVSRIESGRLVLHPERVFLRGLIEEAAMLFEGMAAQKGLVFRLEIDAELQPDVLVDRSRLRQILVNLVGNAIKYTDHGQVTLRAEDGGRDGEYLLLRLDIEDSGPGIDQATLQQLFHPFVQGSEPDVIQGSGLGLYICRSLAQMMGGSIDLQSEPGKGTQVSVMLKLPVMSARKIPVSPPRPEKHGGALTVLVVDDNPAGRMLLIEQLGWLGHRAVGAENSNQALEILENRCPDAVITDCNMPGMSGAELAKILREHYPDLAIFGVTADARESVREVAREAGMRECLFKPVTLSVLSGVLATVFPATPSPAAFQWPGQPELPAALLEGENLDIFLSLQISVLDETLQQLAMWHEAADIPLSDTLHKLRGGLQLLGVDWLQELCKVQEQAPDNEGLRHLEAELIRLRTALQSWRKTGLQS